MAVICLLGVVFAGCAKSEAIPQDTAEVSRGDLIIGVSVSGNLEMPHKTDLSFGTAGMVEQIMVSEGDEVSRGQTLAELDVPSIEANVTMRQAEYDMAKIQLMQTIYPHYTNLYATDLPGAWLALDEAQNNLEEARTLLEQGKTEEAQALLELVKASLDKVEGKAQARVWAVPFSVKVMELQLDEAKAALDMALAELNKATIIAPFGGVVSDVRINEGQQLSAMTYANPAICLIDTSEIEMNGIIDEIDISNVRLGQEAGIILDALPDKEVKGKVTFISQAGTVRAGVVSYKTTITLENPDSELRDSMSAMADIIIDRHENVLLLPNRAIQGTRGNYYVEVAVGEQTEQRQVTLGLSDGMSTEVLSGLEEGDTVVLPRVSQFLMMPFGG
jgi:RND family efflux transporter, MFP subunit